MSLAVPYVQLKTADGQFVRLVEKPGEYNCAFSEDTINTNGSYVFTDSSFSNPSSPSSAPLSSYDGAIILSTNCQQLGESTGSYQPSTAMIINEHVAFFWAVALILGITLVIVKILRYIPTTNRGGDV